MPTDYEQFRVQLAELAKQNGSETTAHLIELIVTEREALAPTSTLRAARRMDWGQAWDTIIGPALDQLEDLLIEHGAKGQSTPPRKTCSCGMAWADEPGHDEHNAADV